MILMEEGLGGRGFKASKPLTIPRLFFLLPELCLEI